MKMTFEDILAEREAVVREEVSDEGLRAFICTMLGEAGAEDVARLTHLPLDRILQIQQSMTH